MPKKYIILNTKQRLGPTLEGHVRYVFGRPSDPDGRRVWEAENLRGLYRGEGGRPVARQALVSWAA